jgi:hypothetical protein
LELKSGSFKQIYDTNPAYQPLAYPILFPYGESGWHPKIPLHSINDTRGLDDNEELGAEDDDNEEQQSTSKRKTVSMLEYYAYHLHTPASI